MLATIAAVAAALLFAPGVDGQNATDNRRYVVWSSVIFTRTGDRTPEILGKLPTQLTSLGAQQAYAAGQFFRNRYTILRNGTNGIEEAGAELVGLNTGTYDQLQTISMALEQQYNVATQQAFMQGLYPPFSPGSGNTTGAGLNPVNIVANGTGQGTYVSTPLNGYQYTQTRSAGPLDPNFVYLSGNLNCPAFDAAAQNARNTPQYDGTQEEFDGLYNTAGSAALIGVLNSTFWDYNNAYAIYDYLRYQAAHNATVRDAFSTLRWQASNVSFLDTLRWLADQQQYAQLGNISALNVVTKKETLPGLSGSISTIAGNTLAARVLDSFSNAINFSRFGRYKLNLFFADYHPMTSFFALAGLPELNHRFYGTANFASSAVFELFSKTNETDPSFPGVDDLYVRFYFRNGTDGDDSRYQAYSLFLNGPDAMDMTWVQFRNAMRNVAMPGIGNWCNECSSTSFFCAAFDEDGNETPAGSRGSSSKHKLSPAVAGVVGAIIALVIAGFIFALAMFVGGVRLHRQQRSRRSDLGGFKGGNKMRSDQDLTLPKGGAIVGASVVENPTSTPGHERVGSWELKNSEAGRNLGIPHHDPESLRPSMEEIRHDPFADPEGLKPTQTREHV
ncbi:Putative histidine phosphatase superfamily [Septoria linicola]|uniref:Histidine phosphatase superfamily n=1 Tax=Septoria linicola TaxID=215465 RepID=A0A9Q9AXP6_9PEZI|nr:Putative histidine phosphatase superfamily [Septoria linicola]